ncbi:MAG: hypothetical protein ACLQU3_30530 [Limisphaerales bacterium]
MKDQGLELDIFRDLLEEASVIGELADDGKSFTSAYEAFRAGDAKAFQAALYHLKPSSRCHLVCEWIRSKECIFLCLELCGPPKLVERPDPRELAEAIVRITSNEAIVRRVVEALEKRDHHAFESVLMEYQLGSLCHLFCHWLCVVRYRLVCRWVCGLDQRRPDLVRELQSAGQALRHLLGHKNAFDQAVAASTASDAEKLGSILRGDDLFQYCHFICEWFCSWRCTLACLTFCRQLPLEPIKNQIREALEFAQAMQPLAGNPAQLERLSAAVGAGDAQAYNSLLSEFKLPRYCIQLCHWVCTLRCRQFCLIVCPPIFNHPWFTHVGDFAIYADIDPGTGLTNKLEVGHGGPNYGFFSGLSLRGFCPKYDPAHPVEPMAYRFLYQPSGALKPTPITGGFVQEVLVGSRYTFWNGNSFAIQTVRIRGTGTTTLTPPPPGPGSTPPDHYIVPDPQGWVTVDAMALDDGFNGSLMGFASPVAFPGGDSAPGVLAGTAVPVGSQKNGFTAAIIFQATRVTTIGTVNGGGTPDYTNQLANIHINNWDEVSLLDLLQFLLPGSTACSPLANDLDILYTVDHELLLAWSFTLTTASGMTLMAPPSGPTVAHPRGDAGTYHQNISAWPSCSYAFRLYTQRKLTDGLNDDSQRFIEKTFCIGNKKAK